MSTASCPYESINQDIYVKNKIIFKGKVLMDLSSKNQRLTQSWSQAGLTKNRTSEICSVATLFRSLGLYTMGPTLQPAQSRCAAVRSVIPILPKATALHLCASGWEA